MLSKFSDHLFQDRFSLSIFDLGLFGIAFGSSVSVLKWLWNKNQIAIKQTAATMGSKIKQQSLKWSHNLIISLKKIQLFPKIQQHLFTLSRYSSGLTTIVGVFWYLKNKSILGAYMAELALTFFTMDNHLHPFCQNLCLLFRTGLFFLTAYQFDLPIFAFFAGYSFTQKWWMKLIDSETPHETMVCDSKFFDYSLNFLILTPLIFDIVLLNQNQSSIFQGVILFVKYMDILCRVGRNFRIADSDLSLNLRCFNAFFNQSDFDSIDSDFFTSLYLILKPFVRFCLFHHLSITDLASSAFLSFYPYHKLKPQPYFFSSCILMIPFILVSLSPNTIVADNILNLTFLKSS